MICFCLGMACLALLQSVRPLVFAWWGTPGPAVTVTARSLVLTNSVETHVTPTGTFEYVRLPLGEPDDLLPDVRLPLNPPRWLFSGYSKVKLEAFFRSSELTDEQREGLLDAHRWETTPEGICVTPSLEIVASLSRRARSQIYPVLAESPVNTPQGHPFRFPLGGVPDRLLDARLSAKTVEVFNNLLYADEGTACFADGAVAQRLLPTQEFKALVSVLYCDPTFLMRLRVSPDTDINKLLHYWSKCGRSRELKPLFQSLARVPGGGAINIEHLLPPFARLRLYTHGLVAPDAAKSRQNCFWTALNFFSEQPDAQYLNVETVFRALDADYHPVVGERQLGDLVCLLDAKGRPAHLAVYIVDDVVFTKDGSDNCQPWVLMKIPDMLVEYISKPSLKLVTLRRNGW